MIEVQFENSKYSELDWLFNLENDFLQTKMKLISYFIGDFCSIIDFSKIFRLLFTLLAFRTKIREQFP